MHHSVSQLRAWVEIDLSQLERNLHAVRAALPKHLKYIAVVKADAYGHGLAAVAARLMRAGADMFAVANLAEAASIRELGSGWPVLLLSPLLPTEIRQAIETDVIPVISSHEEAEALNEAALRQQTKIRIHLKIDTGMGRLGCWHTSALELYKSLTELPGLRIDGICTHFSSADSDPEFTRIQRERFGTFLKQLSPAHAPGCILHADNSAGIDTFPKQGPLNAARVGLLQFGIKPHPGSLLEKVPVAPVLRFRTRVGLVKQLPADTPISYSQTHRLANPGKIAVLTAGYADGIPTTLSNQGEVLIRGQRCRIIGRVTMDQTIVDVTELTEIKTGDVATIVGQDGREFIGVQEFCKHSGQIEWEFFCNLSKRVTRQYLTGSMARP